MKIKLLFLSILFSAASSTYAATVTLKDDRQMEGEIVSQTKDTLVLDVNGIEMTLPTDLISSIDLSATPVKEEAKKAVPEKTAEAKPTTGPATLPVGTPLRIKMDKSLNTRQNKTGQRFTATLEANLMAGDIIVAPRGAVIHGVLANVKSAGRIAGSAEMSLVLTEIMINDSLVSISTLPSNGKGPNAAADTVGKTARAAAIGGLIDGSDGAKTGAKVGVGAALLTKNSDIKVEQGALLDFALDKPLEVK